ncbi:hypothetical protein N2152v2_004615 [Parachlorella kessleri]
MDLAKAGVRIHNGLRSLHVFSSTSQGRSMAAAGSVVRAAWKWRKHLFTAIQRRQLEGWLHSSKSLAALLPRDSGIFETAQQPLPRRPPVQPRQAADTLRKVPAATFVPPPPPPVPASRAPAERSGTSGAALAQPATASLGDKRSHASDDGDASSDGSVKRARAPTGVVAAAAAAMPAVAAPGAVQLPPPPPPSPPHPASSSSMELANSIGAPGSVEQPASHPQHRTADDSAEPDLLAQAESALRLATPSPPPPSFFHGVDVPDDVKGLLGQGKLCLVLDLDHTLLNSARYAEVGPELHDRLERRCAAEEQAGIPEMDRLLFRLDEIKMWTKLRPNVRQFLQTAAQYYELWIHTNGNKSYAAAVTKLLDPTGVLFGQRIIAQGAERLDEMQADQSKSFMQGLEGREAVTIVVDDSHSVWSQHRRNLVVVERYVYFPSSRLQLGINRPSLLEANRDECFEAGMLPITLDVLLRVHKLVLAAVAALPSTLPSGDVVYPNWDVRHVLGELRQRVLRGVTLVFSRVFPLERQPQTHPLWQMAEHFGARCCTSMEPGVTHVVAAAGGTEKVLQARQRGLFVVTPGWLECSCILWRRAEEHRFAVPP